MIPTLLILLWQILMPPYGGMHKPAPQASGNIVAQDNFNGATDNTSLNSRSGWAAVHGYHAGLKTACAGAECNVWNAGGGPSLGASRWTGAGTFTNNQWAEVTVTKGSDVSSADRAGAVVRGSTAVGGSAYVCVASNTTLTILWIHDADGGYVSDLTTSSVSFGSGATLRCEVTGTTITATITGNSPLVVTDTNLTSGTPGIAVGRNDGSAWWSADNWKGGNL